MNEDHRTKFSDILPLRDKAMLLTAAASQG